MAASVKRKQGSAANKSVSDDESATQKARDNTKKPVTPVKSAQAEKTAASMPSPSKSSPVEESDKALLEELIGASTDEDGDEESGLLHRFVSLSAWNSLTGKESKGYHTASETQSDDEDYESDSVSNDDCKPKKSRKVTTNATPTKSTVKARDGTAPSSATKTPTRLNFGAAMIKPKAVSPSKNSQGLKNQSPDVESARDMPDTPSGASKMSKIDLTSSPAKVESDAQAWFSPNKKPDYGTKTQTQVFPAITSVASDHSHPPVSGGHSSYYHAYSALQGDYDDDVV